jgi:hypothetical protein
MGRISNINEMVKATLTEESMASAGESPLQIVKKKAEMLMKDGKMSEEEMDKLEMMMKEMDMDEEADMDAFAEMCSKAESYGEMKKAVEKYMKK